MAGGTNYVLNPRPETNLTSWSATNSVLVRDTANKQPGTGTFCVGAPATATGVVTVSQNASGLTVGKRYTASVYVKVPAAVVRSVYGTAAGVSGQGTDWASESIYDRWTRLQVTFTAASATQTITWTTDGNVTIGASIYLDRMAVVDGETRGPYFDGGYPQCAWTGTAFASTSTSTPFGTYVPTTEEPVLIGALCMNTQAWNVVNRSGRMTIPSKRGASTVVPALSGSSFVANRPSDAGIWGLGLWVLGMDAQGWPAGLPYDPDSQRRVFETNFATIQQAVSKGWQALSLAAWQSDGSVRSAAATVGQQIDGASMMGGIRAEIPIVFEILAGWWKDALSAATTGTPSASWSNQALQLPALAGGTAPIEDAVFTVTGPATNPRITSDSGNWVQCNATVAAGTTWVVDCGAWTSTRNAISNLAEVSHSGHARFLSIPAGELLGTPKVTMTASGTTSATNLALTAARSHWGA